MSLSVSLDCRARERTDQERERDFRAEAYQKGLNVPKDFNGSIYVLQLGDSATIRVPKDESASSKPSNYLWELVRLAKSHWHDHSGEHIGIFTLLAKRSELEQSQVRFEVSSWTKCYDKSDWISIEEMLSEDGFPVREVVDWAKV